MVFPSPSRQTIRISAAAFTLAFLLGALLGPRSFTTAAGRLRQALSPMAAAATNFAVAAGQDGKERQAAQRSKPEGPPETSVIQYDGPLPKNLVSRAPNLRAAASIAFASNADVEPNGTTATASPLSGTGVKVRGNLWPNGDIDFYSFTATAGDRVYAAIMTSGSAGNSTDSQLTVLASDGTTVIEFDDDNGSFAALSSSIAGATIPTTGTYFLRVNDFTAGTTSERAYELWLQLQSGAPTPEVEGNDTPATANPLPANGWVSGTRDPALATEQDWFSLTLNAGDTVFLSLDVNPERDGTVWNGRLGFALFGDANNQILVVDDAGTGDVSPNPNNPSEAFFMTVKNAGTYFAFVDSASAAVGGPTATYHLNVSVLPAPTGLSCTTYTSTDVPQTIGPGTGLVSSTITIPGNPRIEDLDVEIVLNHALMQDVDVHLRSPAGNDNGLFTDIGSAATGGQTQMDVVFDDDAGIPPAFTALRGVQLKPENNSTAGTASTSGAYRLSWFKGENAGGTWTLDIRDDTAGANGGTLTSWALRVCTPPPAPSCAPGFAPQIVFSTDFESGAAGFTHSGTQDEWELGLPATVATTTANPLAPFNTCHSGVFCWKTDLDNTYNASSNQDLLSPNINLAGFTGPVVVSWAMRHQIETANFDHMFIDAQQVGGATPVRLYEWLDPTPISASAGTGNPQSNIGGSIGWGVYTARADSLAGLNTELRFHLDSDSSVQFGGLAIDDVTVTACAPSNADLSITKTDGVATAVPGGSTTYTITASNAGPSSVTGGTVTDTFPATLTCTWTCTGAGGGTCTAAGSGNISDTVNLPAGGSVTYTASCSINASATGTLVNTATVSSSVTDPNPANNSATDTDTLTPMADLSITKTDGVATAVPGGSVTYTITAANPGPSNAPSATVADTFPATLTCTWTCTGAGGGTCTAAGAGNISDTVNLPAGGSVTYTASCSINASATGTLVNTATVSSGVTDPNPANNSATDADTLTPMADLSITKTDGVATVNAGGATTYTITASNAGPSNAPGSTVSDNFPATLTCTWTCTGAGGGTCTAAGSGNINDTVNLPVGGSVTYTASCSISGAATGTLTNTATVAAPGGVTDPNPGNNSATDTDTVLAAPDLSITKTNGVTQVTASATTTYTIVAANPAGSQAVTGATVTDNFPAGLANVTWTCVGAGGGTCPAGGAGNINALVNLPAGASITFTATGTVVGSVPGTLSNTATITAPGGVTDPNLANNSATDADTIICPVVSLAPATLPSGVQGTAYNQSLVASPAGGNYTYAVTTNVLPPGLSLNASTGALTGTPSAAGNYTFGITATGFGTCTKSQSYNLLITGTCTTITVNPTTLPNGTLGTAYPATTVSATGGVAPYTFAVTQGALPAGLALNGTTGEITGTPTAAGTLSFRITATGQGGCTGSRVYVVSVACATLTFDPAALPNGAKGVAYNQPITVTPGTGHTFSVLLGSLPPGYTLSAAGVLSGLTNQAGTWTFTVKALLGSCQATKQYTLTIPNTMAPTALAQLNDYDGDGRADFALWSNTGTWRLALSNGGAQRSAQTLSLGQTDDVTLSGDYDGDGKTDLAVFHPANGTWYIKRSGDGSFLVKAWGVATDVPVPGDYDGDGQTDLAIFRPSDGNWYVLRSSDGQYDVTAWGAGYAPYNDVAVPGDYDGDGRTDLAVFRRATGTWLVKRSSDGQFSVKAWGLGTDIPVAADYDGDGRTDYAIWRGTSWYIWQSTTNSAQTAAWGSKAAPYFDQAVPSDYDGDGKADLAVWRAGEQTWYVRCSLDGELMTQAHGQVGDRAVRGN